MKAITPIVPFLLYWVIVIFFAFVDPIDIGHSHSHATFWLLIFLTFSFASYLLGLNWHRKAYRVLFISDASEKYLYILLFLGGLFLFIDSIIFKGNFLSFYTSDDYRRSVEGSVLTFIGTFLISVDLIVLSLFVKRLFFKEKINRWYKFIVFFHFSVGALAMFSAGNRSVAYSLLCYLFFVLFFLRIGLSKLSFRSKNLWLSIIFLVVVIFFFFDVQVRRGTDDYFFAKSYNSLLSNETKYSNDFVMIGALVVIEGYFTAGLNFFDELLVDPGLLRLDLVNSFGVRVERQFSRLGLDQVLSSSDELRESIAFQSATSPVVWIGLFGLSVLYFGLIGAFLFLGIWFFLFGRFVKQWLSTKSFYYLLLVFSMYDCVVLSFDWLFRNFSFFFVLVFLVAFKGNTKKYYY
jgi:oligosaccharide repeat unit polymerase